MRKAVGLDMEELEYGEDASFRVRRRNASKEGSEGEGRWRDK